jgi:hypothetical protein
VILTDEQKELAKELGLTFTEMHVALSTRIAPERYAQHKRELQAQRDEWEAKMTGMSDDLLERVKYAPPGRGQRPPVEVEEG